MAAKKVGEMVCQEATPGVWAWEAQGMRFAWQQQGKSGILRACPLGWTPQLVGMTPTLKDAVWFSSGWIAAQALAKQMIPDQV